MPPAGWTLNSKTKDKFTCYEIPSMGNPPSISPFNSPLNHPSAAFSAKLPSAKTFLQKFFLLPFNFFFPNSLFNNPLNFYDIKWSEDVEAKQGSFCLQTVHYELIPIYQSIPREYYESGRKGRIKWCRCMR